MTEEDLIKTVAKVEKMESEREDFMEQFDNHMNDYVVLKEASHQKVECEHFEEQVANLEQMLMESMSGLNSGPKGSVKKSSTTSAPKRSTGQGMSV